MINNIQRKFILFIAIFFSTVSVTFSQQQQLSGRQRILLDDNWRFAFGHPYDTKKDFDNGTSYFSYFAKSSYGDGAASPNFDDRGWRKLDLPHDWAVEQAFDKKGSHSHGFKAIGRNFPETSVGWYRKSFYLPATDAGRIISITFDGVFRNSIVWVNGHYLGTEISGYSGFSYNISDYLNYDGENVIAVRADATMEEGWFYEGAGIYRHVWLNKTSPLHVAANGTFVTSHVKANTADIRVQVTVLNEDKTTRAFDIVNTIVNAEGKTIATNTIKELNLSSFKDKDFFCTMPVVDPLLWSLENPYLYKLITTISDRETIIDKYETTFGVRTIRFDASEGFFLNGKPVKLQGTNNHQDHAGVGAAMPDALQDFRIKTLKDFGCNAYRCSHNPPTPELLEACDRLGMLVIDENRLLGITSTHFNEVKKLILRDRNHPSIISWSIGNEEWGIEGNIKGARIASTLQAYTKSLDSSRAITAAISGGWREGISNVIDVMGYNYIGQINTDEHHKKFPNQPGWGTEEGSTRATRGIYEDDVKAQLMAAYDKKPTPNFFSIEDGWKHYAQRNYLAGMFIWTGFDYRGEPTPYGWPSVICPFGMLDLCGFPKDNVFYLKSWWTKKPTIHILPHWNLKGKEGREIPVWVYSNAEAVELFVNKKSLGKKDMPVNGHLEWSVKYAPGSIEAVGYKNGKKIITDVVKTTAEPATIKMIANQSVIKANRDDIALITVAVNDKNGLQVPTADNEVTFTLQGPGKIIGVGNGNPTSLEADKELEKISVAKIEIQKEKVVSDILNRPEIAVVHDDTNWERAFKDERNEQFGKTTKALVYRGSFNLPELTGNEVITFFYNSIGKEQSVYINGNEIAKGIKEDKKGNTFILPMSLLHKGQNQVAIAATPLIKPQPWENINTNAGLIQIVTPAAPFKRKLFNGLAQVIVQSRHEAGEIILKATAAGLKPSEIILQSKK
ncbi:MAG: beta-galactosidase GalA [Ferruginibacter sp.]